MSLAITIDSEASSKLCYSNNAFILGVPILGCEPDVATLYSSKSGAKRIFEDAKVDRGPSDKDIYTTDQVIIVKNSNIFDDIFLYCTQSHAYLHLVPTSLVHIHYPFKYFLNQ